MIPFEKLVVSIKLSVVIICTISNNLPSNIFDAQINSGSVNGAKFREDGVDKCKPNSKAISET